MIVGIEGKVELKEPTCLHINVNGLIYEVNVSLNTSSAINTETVKLFVTQIIREDSDMLFGFAARSEKKMFDTLLKINGVGPKVAQAVCSTFAPDTFARVVAAKDVSMLKRVPGIGPKAASRILVELADFIVDTAEGSAASDHSEAMLALDIIAGRYARAVRRGIEAGKATECLKLGGHDFKGYAGKVAACRRL